MTTTSTPNSNVANNIILGNNVQSNSEHGILLQGGDAYNISGNNVQSNGRVGINCKMVNSIVSGNIVVSNAREGIAIGTSFNNTISANVVYDNGGSEGYAGITLWNADNNIVSSNRISDTAGPSSGTAYLLNITADTCDDNYIVGNELAIPSDATGNLAEIQDLGTGTKYTQLIAGNNILALDSGNVGIGTTSPTRKLHVTDTSNPPMNYECTMATGKGGEDLYIPVDVNGTTYYLKLYQ